MFFIHTNFNFFLDLMMQRTRSWRKFSSTASFTRAADVRVCTLNLTLRAPKCAMKLAITWRFTPSTTQNSSRKLGNLPIRIWILFSPLLIRMRSQARNIPSHVLAVIGMYFCFVLKYSAFKIRMNRMGKS